MRRLHPRSKRDVYIPEAKETFTSPKNKSYIPEKKNCFTSPKQKRHLHPRREKDVYIPETKKTFTPPEKKLFENYIPEAYTHFHLLYNFGWLYHSFSVDQSFL